MAKSISEIEDKQKFERSKVNWTGLEYSLESRKNFEVALTFNKFWSCPPTIMKVFFSNPLVSHVKI